MLLITLNAVNNAASELNCCQVLILILEEKQLSKQNQQLP
jgi:hypothetical protein